MKVELVYRSCSDRQTPRNNTALKPASPPQLELEGSLWCDRDYTTSRGERRLLNWMTRAAALSGKSTIRIALIIMAAAVRHRRKRYLMITPEDIAKSSMSRIATYDGLRALESAGLVTVLRYLGRRPLVSIVEPDQAAQPEPPEATLMPSEGAPGQFRRGAV